MMRLISCILLISVLHSCKKKEQEIRFEGTVRDLNSNTIANGVTIKLYYQEIGNGSFSTAYKFLSSTTSDANGKYTLSFEKPSAASYRFEVSSNRDFTNSFDLSSDLVSSKEVNQQDLKVVSKSWFLIRIHNATPAGIQDEIIYQNSGVSDCNQCCNTDPFIHTGMQLDTTFVCMKKGGTNINFNYTVTKAGNTNQYTQSLYCAPYDTTYFYLSY